MSKTISQKVPLREKIGYSLGDSSANFVFQIMMIFQLGFYTDVFGIKATAAGTILLLARIVDAFIDPTVGILADRTNTRWGKYRPWVLWTALPFGVFFVLAFSTPDISERWKILYAGITYIMLMAMYSANNTPYSTLLGVMSGNVDERTNISSIRFVFAMAASFLVQGLTLPLVAKLGKGNAQLGWTLTTSLFAVIALIFFVITFFSTKERITPPPGQKTSIKQDVKDIFGNGPWRAMFILTLFLFVTLAMWGSATYYFFNYYMDKASIFGFLQHFGLVNGAGTETNWWRDILNAFGLLVNDNFDNAFNVGFSFFNMSGQLVTILGVLTLSQPLARRFGKRNVFIVCLTLTALFTALFITVPANNVGLAFGINLLKSLAYAPTIPLLWAMMADVADFSEWKNFRRATGFVFAGIVFALKAGLGVGGALCGWILDLFGYVPNQVQSASAITGIRLTSSVFPAITFMIGVGALFFYVITKSMNEKVQTDLEERRKAHLA